MQAFSADKFFAVGGALLKRSVSQYKIMQAVAVIDYQHYKYYFKRNKCDYGKTAVDIFEDSLQYRQNRHHEYAR